MLKIKDDVDLDILVSKYEFNYVRNDNCYAKSIDWNLELWVLPNRNIELKIDAEYEDSVTICLPDIILKLIKDGLVF